jgi:hypothetical protein
MAAGPFRLSGYVGLAIVVLSPTTAGADGGALWLSRECAGYRISLFTSPTPLRAGLVDFSVLLQSTDRNVPLPDVPVTVHVYPEGEPQRRRGGPATTQAATNKLFRAIPLELPEPGRWHVEIAVHDPNRPAKVNASLDVGAASSSALELSIWIGWPLGVVLLFAIHQGLVRAERASEEAEKPALARRIRVGR